MNCVTQQLKRDMSRNEFINFLEYKRSKEKRECEASYYNFFKAAWRILEPNNPFVDNWHFKYLCDEFQEEIHRIGRHEPKTTDVIANIPPRSGKSMMASVQLTPWAWIHYPWLRFINSSFDMSLSTDHLVGSRDIIRSDWYQENWGHIYQLSGDQNVKGFYKNDKRGYRLACSVGSPPTGKGADVIIADDLIDPMAADSEADRIMANKHYDQALYNRLNQPSIGVRFLIMQRLNEDDTAGNAMKKNPQGYRKIVIPAEITSPIEPPELNKNYKDGLFFPQRFTKEILSAAEMVHGKIGFASQYNQAIIAGSGNNFQRTWFNTYGRPPEMFDVVRSYWDLSFKKGPKNSYVVGQVWGVIGKANYLLFQYRAKAGINESEDAIIMVLNKFPMISETVIEDKANGPAVMEQLANVVPNLVPWPRENKMMDSKEARWLAASPIVRQGNVWIPSPEPGTWAAEIDPETHKTAIEVFLTEVTTAPNSKYKDQIDTFAMAMIDSNSDSLEELRRFVNLLKR